MVNEMMMLFDLISFHFHFECLLNYRNSFFFPQKQQRLPIVTSPPCIDVLELLHGGCDPVRTQCTRVEDSTIFFYDYDVDYDVSWLFFFSDNIFIDDQRGMCSWKIHWPVSKVVEIPLTRCLTAVILSTWQDGTLIWRCLTALTLISRVYALIWWCFSSNWYSGWTDTADRHRWWSHVFHVFFYMSYETPLCISSGFCELAASSNLSTRACCVTSAELTIKKNQRQPQSGNFIISNLKTNFHHIDYVYIQQYVVLVCSIMSEPLFTLCKHTILLL